MTRKFEILEIISEIISRILEIFVLDETEKKSEKKIQEIYDFMKILNIVFDCHILEIISEVHFTTKIEKFLKLFQKS